MRQFAQQKIQMTLSFFPRGDILNDGNQIFRSSDQISLQRDGNANPRDASIAPDKALLHPIGLRFAREQPAHIFEFDPAIFGVGNVLDIQSGELLARISQDMAQPLIDAKPCPVEPDVGDADSRIFERAAESGFARAQCVFIMLPFRQIVEIANHAKAPVGQRQPLGFPIVGFDFLNIVTAINSVGRVVGLACFERAAENCDGFAGKWLFPDAAQHFRQVPPQQRAHIRENLLCAGADQHQSKIRIDQINAKWRVFDESAKRRLHCAQRRFALGKFARRRAQCPANNARFANWKSLSGDDLSLPDLTGGA